MATHKKALDGLKDVCITYKKVTSGDKTTKEIIVKGVGSITDAGKAVDRINH